MKLRHHACFSRQELDGETVPEYFVRVLVDSVDMDVEDAIAAQRIAIRTASALGRLVDLLAQKQLLTAHEVMLIAENFSTQSVELTE